MRERERYIPPCAFVPTQYIYRERCKRHYLAFDIFDIFHLINLLYFDITYLNPIGNTAERLHNFWKCIISNTCNFSKDITNNNIALLKHLSKF